MVRHRPLNPFTFADALWADVATQHVVVVNGKPAGLMALYAVDWAAGTAWVDDIYFNADQVQNEDAAARLHLFLQFAFACWPLRKVYFSAVTGAVSGVRRVGLGEVEAVFAKDSLVDAEYRDLTVTAVYADEWNKNDSHRLRELAWGST